MRTALEAAHRGFGESCIIGVAAAGKEIATRPFQLVTGRQWKGTAFGGWKSREDVPKLVNKVVTGEYNIDDFVTHTFESLDDVNKSIETLHSGNCLRAIVKIAKFDHQPSTVKVLSSQKYCGGVLKTVSHWSNVNNCEMKFMIFLPNETIKEQRGKDYPALYFLAGLTSNQENAPIKSHFGPYAAKHRIAMIFPDTSPRGIEVEGLKNDWWFGDSAGYYLNATDDKYSKHFNMYTYITEELPKIVNTHFPVDCER